MQPITIGISSYLKKIVSNFSNQQSAVLVPSDYLELFKEHDVIPLILSPFISVKNVDEICKKIDALFLIGGEDLDSSFYNEKPQIQYVENIPSVGIPGIRPCLLKPNPLRDQFEMALYLSAKKRKIPIFGNCRGMQIINVAEGGSLFQEIPSTMLPHFINEDGWVNYHEVNIESNCKWNTLLNKSLYTTSSSHHQAIKKIAPSMKAVGHAPDGIIEMIEHQDETLFILGIQGHIEKLITTFPNYKRIIQEFVQKSKETREKR